MPYRKLTGQISHRHPFHGNPELEREIMRKRYIYRPRFGEDTYYHTPDMYDFDVAAIDKLYKGVQGCPTALGQFDVQKAINTLATGAIIGLGTYAVARLLLGKPIKTSRTWGLWGGGIVAALSIVADIRKTT